ncbi:MAG: mechanosensitive ion channel [Lentisphaeria bacterium]|nr:mechanosensitive ion channel [Lentisphaeria bacterium]
MNDTFFAYIHEVATQPVMIPVFALAVGLALGYIFFFALKRLCGRSHSRRCDIILRYARRPALLLIPLLAAKMSGSLPRLPDNISQFYTHVINLLLVASFAYLAINGVRAFKAIIYQAHDVTVADNLKARKITTQVDILVKIAIGIILVIAVSLALMTFQGIRQIGVSILASAGVTGIIVGMAAQKTLSNLFAGVQIAFTQPIRIDDVVIVENEWGRIEEITLTFVVVRIWDLRRLVLPISYFIEKPFQNWTRTSADILGSVFIYTDYTVPVDAIRKETERFVSQSKDWDKQVCVVQVTDSKPAVLELRLLVSAKDASTAWNLRCALREAIIDFIQKNYPESLPRTRAEVSGALMSPKQS